MAKKQASGQQRPTGGAKQAYVVACSGDRPIHEVAQDLKSRVVRWINCLIRSGPSPLLLTPRPRSCCMAFGA